ncbi:MAG: serine/threonine protein kinase [Lachnospiraceae bacterium]|nr:serine/threonine protein kinase [Lachnospiraceae bacterium]
MSLDINKRLTLSYYKTITAINESHNIYLVKHSETGKVCVKKILDVYNTDIYRRLYNNHIEGTPRIIDFDEEDGRLTVIEEYICGTSLSEMISSGTLTADEIINYMISLCTILEKLHSQTPPIIHRDIKPSNVIITGYNELFLLDFNAAKHYNESENSNTVLLGTEGYAAPEQYGFGSSSPKTDIYALGILLKEMLDSANLRDTIYTHIVDKCTKLDPKERYKNVTALKSALKCQKPIVEKKAPNGILQFLPPGFRTLTPWKMIVATLSYLFFGALFLTMEIGELTGYLLWLERIFIFLMFLGVVAGSCNYMDIQSYIPIFKTKNKFLHFLFVILLDVGIVFGLLILLFILEQPYYE